MSDDGSRIAVRALIYGELDSGKSLTLLYSFDSATNDWLKTAEIEDEAGGDSYGFPTTTKPTFQPMG